MKFSPITLLVALALPLSCAAKSNNYQNELTLLYSKGEIDTYDTSNFALVFHHNFDIVRDEAGPYREQAFLQRSSQVDLALGHNNMDTSDNTNLAGPSYGFNITTVMDGSPLIVSASYIKESLESENDTDIQYSQYHFDYVLHEFTIGSYLGKRSAIALGYMTEKFEADEKMPNGDKNKERQTDDSIILSFKHLAELGDEKYLRLEPTVTQTEVLNEDQLIVEVDLGFYVNRSAQFTAIVERNFETNLTAATFGFEYFATSDAAFGLQYIDHTINDSDRVQSEFQAYVNTRF